MATNRKLDNEIRERFLKTLMEMFEKNGEDVVQTNSNELAFPIVDEDGNDKWVQIVVKVPTGGRDEDGYDGYGVAESYKMKLKEKEENPIRCLRRHAPIERKRLEIKIEHYQKYRYFH